MTTNFDFKESFSKKRLTRNIGLKIISLISAIFIWLVVVNVTDPIVPAQYRNVPVRIVNEKVITDDGKTLEVIDATNVIATVTIKASRTTIRELGNTNDCIVATADMANLSIDGTSVPISITTSKYADKIDSIRASANVLKVNIEEKKSIQLPIKATTSGEIESGYILGNVKPNQNQVRVSGPESVISTIKSAAVDVQVTGFTDDISTQSEVILYDEEGDEISKANLELNIDSVRVDAEILATKRVPIYYAVSGVPAEGYGATGEVSIVPETVVIAGNASDIYGVTNIAIPSTDLNITGQEENLFAVLNLKDYMGKNLRLADENFGGSVNVTVFIEPIEESELTVFERNISILNIPEGFEAKVELEAEDLEFTVKGLAQNLEKIDPASLNYRVDFEDYILLNENVEFEAGAYELYLVMDLPDGVDTINNVPVKVVLSKDK